MTPGLFDLPAPLLHRANEVLVGWVSAPVAIALWASLGAVICLELYRMISPQQRLGHIKRKADAARRQLNNYDGAMEDAWPLMQSMLTLSLRRVAIVIPATLLSAYPVVALLIWMSNEYDHRFPVANEYVEVKVTPPLTASWIGTDDRQPYVQVLQPPGAVLMNVPVRAPIPKLHKPAWWNLLVANPAGYLPATAPVDEISLELPERDIVGWGPAWLRNWEVVFIPVLFVVALGYKYLRRIH